MMETSKAKQIALARFKEKFNCAEAVLMGLAEAEDMSCGCIPRIATGFGGGVGGWGEVCGALAGAVMAFGVKCGRESGEDIESKNAVYAMVKQLFQTFEREFGTIRCFDLVECDMRTPEGMARAKELDLHNKVCPDFVGFAAEVAERLMKND